MKLAITGHTKGIGKALYDRANIEGYETVGFSRSNGYDLSLTRLVDKIVDADVFINNAYSPLYQTQLLRDILKEWKDKDKLIVNISSKISLLDKSPPGLEQYYKDKKQQNNIMRKHSIRAYPRLLNVIPVLVDTDMAKVYDVSTKIKPKDLADMIFPLIKHNSISVQQLVIDAPHFDWKSV